jgi:hypothetical protein
MRQTMKMTFKMRWNEWIRWSNGRWHGYLYGCYGPSHVRWRGGMAGGFSGEMGGAMADGTKGTTADITGGCMGSGSIGGMSGGNLMSPPTPWRNMCKLMRSTIAMMHGLGRRTTSLW